MRLASAAVTALALFASRGQALQIHNYDAAVNERFASGFESGAPVANTSSSFTLAGYNLSGVGWQAANNDFAVTLVSPRVFLTAAHVAPGTSSTVSFLGADGVKRNYTVSSVSTLTYNGQNTDLALGVLTEAVDTAQIGFYAGIYLGNSSAHYQNLPVTLYGANGRVGTNTVDAVGAADLLPFGHTDTQPNDSVISVMDFDPVTGEAQGQGGDSGSPTFVRVGGNQLALFGIHSAINANPPPQQTYDSLPLFAAYSQIDAAVIAAGYAPGWGVYDFTASPIPEPASAAALAGLGAALAGGLRRRRRA